MTPPRDIAELNERFRWSAARKPWIRVLTGPGPLVGDCKDYAVTALWVAAGSTARAWWLLLTFRAWLVVTKLPGGPTHMMLWLRGRGWIDNVHPTFGPRRLPILFPAPWPVIALLMLIGKAVRR